jgi:hypothetical protein
MDGILLIVLIVAVVSGAASAHIAGAKGLDKPPYFVLGFLFPLIGILVAGFMPPSEDNKAGHTDDRLVAAAPPASSDDEWITSLRNLKDDGDSKVLETYREPFFEMMRQLRAHPDGERILAYGVGHWDNGVRGISDLIKDITGPFLLTDRRIILYEADRRNRSVWIGDTAEFTIKSATGAIKIPGLELLVVRQKRNAYRVEELLGLAKKPHSARTWIEVSPAPSQDPTPPAPGQDPTPTPASTTVQDLERLADLYREGLISQDEFEAMKLRLFEGSD